MEKGLRNELRNTVTKCRELLEDAVEKLLQGQFGIHLSGEIEDAASMKHLSPEDLQYREQVVTRLEHIKAAGFRPKDAVQQLIREATFTHLNRVCAYKMMEARGLIRGAVSKGIKSQGFIFYLADHPEDENRWKGGEQETAYQHYLIWQGEQFAHEIPALFCPNDPANRLFPPQRVLDQVLELINSDLLKDIWQEDETIGWIYQYFTPKELRDQARMESAAPRNSYELAFRNQFYTPRYVVQFLTDNTLGRIWYEMRRGDTALKEKCQYLVYRPKEVFLAEGEEEPDINDGSTIFIRYRAKKDPRDLRILDPASGSGHFLIYGFDLLETIYDEAYDDPALGPQLQRDFPDREEFCRAVPGLILRHNLHGIDIDLRATQIAALALWLRAQRTYQRLGLKRNDRPKITKSNIVCAEPMPGEAKLLEEFVASLRPKALGDMVRLVFEKMKLAGEAGSLLKIEEEISRVVAEKKRQYKDEMERATDKFGNVELLTRGEVARLSRDKQTALDFSDITDEQFWESAEERILDELRRYSQGAANGQGLLRQLFAEDAELGFAFVDICRKHFDVVLMNPPFGAPSDPSRAYVERAFPRTKNDVFAAFVERWLGKLRAKGMLGAITSRVFFSFVFPEMARGSSVGASSPASRRRSRPGSPRYRNGRDCGVLLRGKVVNDTLFFRLLAFDEKSGPLQQAIDALHEGTAAEYLYQRDPQGFRAIPTSPFAYAVGDRIRDLFQKLPPTQSGNIRVAEGLNTTDNERFLRLAWEAPVGQIGLGRRWVPLAKGGEHALFYSDIHLLVDWENNGERMKSVVRALYGSETKRIYGQGFYFRAGLTYSQRTQKGLSFRCLPRDSIFNVKGPGIFADEEFLPILLGLVNSLAYRSLVELQTAFGSYNVGYLQRTPLPALLGSDASRLGQIALSSFDLVRSLDTLNETSHVFCVPEVLQVSGVTLAARAAAWGARVEANRRRLAKSEDEIDDISFRLYGITTEDRRAIIDLMAEKSSEAASNTSRDEEDEDTEVGSSPTDQFSLVASFVSYAIGCTVGRWDVRLATGERVIPELPDRFAPLPVCAPGMLTEEPRDYPLTVDRDGILPDDPDHADDIVRRVHEVFALIWRERAEAIEQEACGILGLRELRDYFWKPAAGGFWADHIARYSKSRRKAPIYWLLQSARKSYALWLYYHRLDGDTLSKALINYVEPKLRLEDNRLNELRSQRTQAGATGSARALDRQIERQEDLLSELNDFADKLRRVIALHLTPDLNDGVVLNIAPLWELVPWKEAKKCWDELRTGRYKWSSISKQLQIRGLVKD